MNGHHITQYYLEFFINFE